MITRIVIGVVSYILGFLTMAIVAYAGKFSAFFDIKLTDVTNIILTIILASFVAYLIQNKVNNTARQRELVMALLDRLQEKLGKIFDVGTKYMETNDKELTNQILAEFKGASSCLNLVTKVAAKKTTCEKALKEQNRPSRLILS